MVNRFPITRTKVMVPRRRAELLSRRRLLDLVEDLLDNRLIILTAPAGYGKTSLMVDFAHTASWPICWYALDGLDQDPQRFIAHLIASIQQRFPYFGIPRSGGPLPGGECMAAINSASQSALDVDQMAGLVVNDLYEQITEHFLIVIDDFHLVESSPAVVRFINRFLQDMDENCHVVLSSRTLLALPDLTLMVARSQVGGLSFEDLAFQPEEIQSLLLRNYQIHLTDAEARGLGQETEGWVTGLLLSTQIMGKTVAQQARVARVSGVGVYEYLAQQIFERQDDDVQRFLLWTALLDEFDAEACEQVIRPALGVALNWHALILTLLRLNLFVLPVGDDGLTLRYHHLFQAVLRERVQRDRPEEARRILLRLAEVYTAREEWERAFAIFQQLNVSASLEHLVEQAGSQLIARGQLVTLADWFDALSPAVLQSNPRLISLQATLLQDRGDPTTALRLHTLAIQSLREQDDSLALALALTRRATAYRLSSQYRESSADAQAALAVLEPRWTNQLIYADALLSQGVALYFLGQPDQALGWYQQALPAYQLLKDDSAVSKTWTYLGATLKTLGRFSEAERAYQQALSEAQSSGNMVWQANLYNSIGLLQHTLGDYPAALHSFDQAINYTRVSGAQRFEAYVLAGIGDLYLELDAFQETHEAYRQAREAAIQTKETYLIFYLNLVEARLALAESDPARARELVQQAGELAGGLGSLYQEKVYRFEQARLALAEGRYADARAAALDALTYFEGESYQIETPGARMLALVCCLLAGDAISAQDQANRLLELLPRRDLTKLLAVAARELKIHLAAWAADPALAPVVSGLLRLVEQFEAGISGWRRSVRRQAEVVPFAPPRLHIRALGKIQVKAGERTLSGADWQVQTARDLLFLLLSNPEGLTKEQIGELFWPDSSFSELKLRFKNTIYRLRHAAGKEVIVFQGDIFYQFNRNLDYEYDVESFLKEIALAEKESNQARAAAHYRSALKLYRGAYLPEVDLEWALVERERLHQIRMVAILALGRSLLASRDYDGALRLSQQALSDDPCQEEAHRLAMRVYAAQGNRAMVTRQYELCRQSLLDEVGADPSNQTRILYQSLTA